MKREALLQLLDRANRAEEESVATLSRHVKAAMAFSPFTAGQRARAVTVLEQLHQESILHHRIINGLRRRIEAERRDVY